jgi:hypothetical protein
MAGVGGGGSDGEAQPTNPTTATLNNLARRSTIWLRSQALGQEKCRPEAALGVEPASGRRARCRIRYQNE